MTAYGQEQHVEVVQLVHCAQVVAGHVLGLAAATFIAVNSESATNNPNKETTTFFIFPSKHKSGFIITKPTQLL